MTVAPNRVGYVVRQGDRAGVLRAISAATRRWGGITEPILPIGDDGSVEPLDLRIVKTLAPDLLVAVDDNLNVELLSDDIGQPVVPWIWMEESDSAWQPAWCHPARIESHRDTTLVAVEHGPLRDLAGFRAPDPSNGWSFFRRMEVLDHAYRGEERLPDQAYRAQLRRETPLWATLNGMAEQARGTVMPPRMPGLIWFAEPESIDDVVGFWNARALIALTVPDPVAVLLPPAIEPWLEFPRQVADALRMAGFLRRCRPDAAIYSHSVPIERLRELADHLELFDITEDFPYTDSYPTAGRGEDDPMVPICATVGLDPTPWLIYPRSYGIGVDRLVQVFRRHTTIDAPWPVNFSPLGGGLVRTSVSQLSCLGIPRRDEVVKAFDPLAFWQPGEHQPMLSSLSTLTGPGVPLFLQIPTDAEVLTLALKAHRAHYKTSDKGKYGLALLERVPEIASFVDRRDKINWIRQLATARTSGFTRQLEDLLGTVGIESGLEDQILSLAQDHFALPFRPVSELGPKERATEITELFELLTSVGFTYRGLALRCETCGIKSFVELPVTGPRPTCPGCGSHVSYLVDQERDSGLSVHYRLNTLLSRAADGGVLPTLAVIGRLERQAQNRGVKAHLVPGADVYVEEKHIGEIDVLGFIGQQVIAGEVKSSPQDFTPGQIDKDLKKALAVGADVFVIGSVDPINQEQRSDAQAKAERNGCHLEVIDLEG